MFIVRPFMGIPPLSSVIGRWREKKKGLVFIPSESGFWLDFSLDLATLITV